MNGLWAEAFAVVALLAAIGGAVVRPWGLSEAACAVPAAAVLIASGAEPWRGVTNRISALWPSVVLLLLILAVGYLCRGAGVFDYLGALAASASRGDPRRLLVQVVLLAALVTAVLTLDATVVLLTPVILRTARRLRVPARPHLYACTQLANSGSLLLPISNLTNLIAFSASGLSFARFTGLMAVPWIAAVALEWAGLRLFFREDVQSPASELRTALRRPRYALVVVGLTVAGLIATSAAKLAPAWAALAGLVLLAVPALRSGTTTPGAIVRQLNLGFGAFVLALGVIVDAVARHGLGSVLAWATPAGTSLLALLGLAFLAAAVANLVNNLPATLALLPIVADRPWAVLAVLLGVNVGPNATFAGSLATLLWRRMLPARQRPPALEFHTFGLVSVPVVIASTTLLLWLGTRI
jgi:arsenical pump membrane protein